MSRRPVLAALGTSLAVPRIAAAQGAAAAELRIGSVYPLSGPLALLGDESFRGLELAVEERNGTGGLLGRPIRLLRGDAQDQTGAVAEARRLIGAERASVLFGSYASGISFAATQVSELQGVPFFELGAIADNITERGFRYVFRTCPRASDFGRVTVDSLADVLSPLLGIPFSALKVSVLHEDGLYGKAVSDSQVACLRERGRDIAERIGYSVRSADLSGAVQRLRAAAVDVVLHTAYQNDVTLFYRNLREAGWQPRMVIGAGAGYSLTETARAIGRGFEGTMNVDFTQFEVAERAAPGVGLFVEAYKRQYGSDPRSGHSLVNFAGARMCLDAIQRAGAMDKDRIRATVLATNVPEGGTPAGWGARFDERGQNTRAQPWLLQWQDGRQVTIHPAEAAVAQPRAALGPP